MYYFSPLSGSRSPIYSWPMCSGYFLCLRRPTSLLNVPILAMFLGALAVHVKTVGTCWTGKGLIHRSVTAYSANREYPLMVDRSDLGFDLRWGFGFGVDQTGDNGKEHAHRYTTQDHADHALYRPEETPTWWENYVAITNRRIAGSRKVEA